eukprot:3662041-Rhodomonas_salina.5
MVCLTLRAAGQPNDLSGEQYRVYDLVTRHFLATVSPDAVYLQTKVQTLQGPFLIEGCQRMLDCYEDYGCTLTRTLHGISSRLGSGRSVSSRSLSLRPQGPSRHCASD